MYPLLISILALLTNIITADIVGRTQCKCSSPSGAYRGFVFVFSYLPKNHQETTLIIQDLCFSAIRLGACSQDLTYLKEYKTELDGHVFKYHRELFGPDEYEIDGSGRRDIPVKAAHEMGDVKGFCNIICSSYFEGLKGDCNSKSACKAQVSLPCKFLLQELIFASGLMSQTLPNSADLFTLLK